MGKGDYSNVGFSHFTYKQFWKIKTILRENMHGSILEEIYLLSTCAIDVNVVLGRAAGMTISWKFLKRSLRCLLWLWEVLKAPKIVSIFVRLISLVLLSACWNHSFNKSRMIRESQCWFFQSWSCTFSIKITPCAPCRARAQSEICFFKCCIGRLKRTTNFFLRWTTIDFYTFTCVEIHLHENPRKSVFHFWTILSYVKYF